MIRMTTVLATLALFAAPALAAGDNNSGSGAAEKPVVKTCKHGEVWSKKQKKCVAVQSEVIPDGELYEQGRELATTGDYEGAIALLTLVTNQNDPNVLNYLGYSHRKSGKVDEGIVFYKKALEIDPNFVLAREYLGEGYVVQKKFDLAKVELAEIEKRCGKDCEEYKDLAEAIDKAN